MTHLPPRRLPKDEARAQNETSDAAVDNEEDDASAVSSLRTWSLERAGPGDIAKSPSLAVENGRELERMGALLALTAEILRKLAHSQREHERLALADMAETVEGVVGRLADILRPVGRRH